MLDGCADFFESNTYKYGRTTFWLPPVGEDKLAGLEIEIDQARVFQSGGNKISWNPIRVVLAPNNLRLAILQALAEKEQEYQAQAMGQAEHRATLL
ncbi:MAG: hypothetical protein AB2556_24275, partial [Candidatus Thiodiazotropha sp.]